MVETRTTMATMFERARSMIDRVMKVVDPVVMVYTQTRTARSVTLTGRLGRQVAQSQVQGKTVLEYSDDDLIITAADLVFAGAVALPEDGDRVTYTLAGQSITVELMPRNSEQPWRYSDPQRTMLRLHVKQVI